MSDFAGFDFGSVLAGLRPRSDDDAVVMHALEETMQGLLTFLPVRVPDGTPVIRYSFRILGRCGADLRLVSVDGTARRFGRHDGDLPTKVIDYALRFLPDAGRPPPDTVRRFLADRRLGTLGAVFIGQTVADNVVVAAAHHPIMDSAGATGFLRAYLTEDAAKALRLN